MATTSRTGWTVDNLTDLADGPAMIKELGDQIGNEIGSPTYATAAALPSTGNFAGRMGWVTATNTLYRHNGSAWKPVVATRSESGVLTHAYGGGIGPVSTNIVFATAFASPPAISIACNDPRFTLFYGGLSSTGVTVSSQANSSGITVSLSVSWTATGSAA